MPHTDAIVILTTVASDEEAVKFVRTLLERRLIACGTLFPAARHWEKPEPVAQRIAVADWPHLQPTEPGYRQQPVQALARKQLQMLDVKDRRLHA